MTWERSAAQRDDAAMLIGYHTRAGTPGGLLSHTWVGALVHEIRLNGRPAGEALLNAAILGLQRSSSSLSQVVLYAPPVVSALFALLLGAYLYRHKDMASGQGLLPLSLAVVLILLLIIVAVVAFVLVPGRQ